MAIYGNVDYRLYKHLPHSLKKCGKVVFWSNYPRFLYLCMFFQEPYFTKVDFKADSDFAPTVTDSGLCHVMNGPPIGAVFAKSERVGQLEGRNSKDILGTSRILKLVPNQV